MKKIISTGYFLLCVLTVFAQKGNFFLSDYQHTFNHISYETNAIVQGTRGQMYFATPKGVVRYDGNFWTQIKTGYAVNDLAIANDQIFTAGRDACGIIFTDIDGKEKYKSITSQPLEGNFISIKVIGQKVYFISSVRIIEYNAETDQILTNLVPNKQDAFQECFTLADQVFIKSSDKYLWQLKKGKLSKTNIQLPDSLQASFVFAEPLRTSARTFIGTFDGQFLIFDGKRFQNIDFEDSKYLKNSILTNAKILNRNLMVFSTFQGGLVILKMNDNKTFELSNDLENGTAYINYQNGLQDNEILALGTDKNNGIWVAHDYGYSRIDYDLPINRFDYYGLDGNILDVKTLDKKLYVATGNGIYYLDKADRVSIEQIMGKLIDKKTITVERLIQNPRWQKHLKTNEKSNNKALRILQKKSEKQTKKLTRKEKRALKRKQRNTKKETQKKEDESSSPSEKTIENPETKEAKKKKGFWKRIFGKKEKEKQVNETKEKSQTEKIVEAVVTKQTTRKTIPKTISVTETIEAKADPMLLLKRDLALKSVKYLFKKIPNLEGKFKRLVPYKDGLLASGHNGIFFIKGKEIRKISDLNVAHLYIPKDKDYLCVVTLDRDFAIIFPDRNETKPILYDQIDDFLGRMTQDRTGNIWVCGTDAVYQLQINDSTGIVSQTKSYAIENEELDDIYPLRKGKRLYFVSLSGVYTFVNQKLITERKILSQITPNSKIISQSDELIWIFDNLHWYNSNGDESQFLSLLNCIPNLSNVIVDENRQIWVVNRQNQLYRFDIKRKYTPKNYELFLDHVRNDQGILLSLDDLVFDYDLGGIGFRFNMPDYFSGEKLEFRYLLKGKMQEWSAWNRNATVIFPPLENGSYTLLVECRDAFGNVAKKEVPFKVNPPYWRTIWFMSLELLFFGGLFGLIMWVNKKFNFEGIIWVKGIITMLVLILCMEFIKVNVQVYFGLDGSSPVEDFGLEVFMALLLFPLERLLSRAIRKPSSREKSAFS